MNHGSSSVRFGRKPASIAVIFISLLIAVGQHYGWFDTLNDTVAPSQPGLYRVTHFTDGDTINVDMNGAVESIRFIGVDTPETHKPGTPIQCYGPEAAAFTKRLIGDKSVRLQSDPENTNRDRYDRLLRYVYLPDGTLVNQTIIEEGYGFYYPYFPFTKSQEFAAAQGRAQTAHKGLWSACHPKPTDAGGYISNNASD